MTAKEYLSQILDLSGEIRWYLEEIERLETLAEKTTGTLRNDKVQVTVDKQKMERAVVRLLEHKDRLAQTVAIYVEDRERIIAQIKGLDESKYRELLFRKYVSGKTFEQIAVDMDYSWRHTIRIHGSALEAFKEKYEEFL